MPTPNLSLPFLESGQAQKHVTLNESLRLLDTVTQLAVAAVSASPPSEPVDGERHIVGAGPSGAFSGHAGEVAAFQDGAWVFLAPRPGWRAWNADTEELLIWSGAAWTALSGGGAGDVTGPAGATDHAIARYDGASGKLLQDSGAAIDDNGVISAPRVVAGNTDTTPMVVKQSADDAAVGPILDFERVSASPAADDSLGRLNFSGRDSGGSKTDYANITAQIVEAGDGNESGQLYLQTLIDGVLTTVLTLGKNLFGVFTAGNIGDGHLVVGDGGGKGVKGIAPRNTLVVPAASWSPAITNGAGRSYQELAANDLISETLDFDDTAQEFATFEWFPPERWNAGTVTFRYRWRSSGGGASDTLDMALSAVAISNDDAEDAAPGTPIVVTDTWIANGDHHVSAESGAVTIAGAPAKADKVVFKLQRNVSTDDLTGDAGIEAVEIFWTADAATDA